MNYVSRLLFTLMQLGFLFHGNARLQELLQDLLCPYKLLQLHFAPQWNGFPLPMTLWSSRLSERRKRCVHLNFLLLESKLES